jgi:ribosomal protein L33
MEEAFLKIKIIASDTSDLDRKMERIKKEFHNSGMLASKGFVDGLKISGAMTKIFATAVKNTGKELYDIYKKIVSSASTITERGDKTIEKEQNAAFSLEALKSLMGSGSYLDSMLIQQMQGISGTGRFYSMITNFITKLNESRQTGKGVLADYKYESNMGAFLSVIEDLNSGKIKNATAFLGESFGQWYVDNAKRISEAVKIWGGIDAMRKNRVESINGMMKEVGYEGSIESFMKKVFQDITKTMAEAEKMKVDLELKKMVMSSSPEYSANYLKNLAQKNELELLELKKYGGASVIMQDAKNVSIYISKGMLRLYEDHAEARKSGNMGFLGGIDPPEIIEGQRNDYAKAMVKSAEKQQTFIKREDSKKDFLINNAMRYGGKNYGD